MPYRERWACETCGKIWDTSQIPAADYDTLVRGISRYRLVVLGPPIALAAILVPLAILVGIQYAFLLFVLEMAWGLLAVPQLRRRFGARITASTKSWKLRPEQ